MKGSFSVCYAREMMEGSVVSTMITRPVPDLYKPFIADLDKDCLDDSRSNQSYTVGSGVTESGIIQRWVGYENDYHAHDRLHRFWLADFTNTVVEPENMSVIVGQKIMRETLRSAATLQDIFPTLTKKEAQKAFGDSTYNFSTEHVIEPSETIPAGILLGYGMFRNYFNWTIRYASRIMLASKINADLPILVPSSKHKYVEQTLQAYGVRSERVKYIDKPVKVDKLYLSSPFALGRYELSPLIVQGTRNNPTIAGIKPISHCARLYIPRANVKMRNVINEQDVISALQNIGFKIFDNAQHSVAEQIQAFKSAELIVAPHGAGLSNIVYCSPSTKILELIPEGYDQGVTSYRSLSDLFKLDYKQVFCKEMVVDIKGNRCNSDIAIDIHELLDCIDAFVRRRV